MLDFQKNHGLQSNFSIGNLSKHFNLWVVCSFLRDKTHAYTDLYSGDLKAMTLLNLLLLLSLAICCTLQEVHLPMFATLRVQFILSSIQGLHRMTLSTPSSSSVSFFPQGDRGGHLTLQKRWTSFLKARLTCSLPEYDFHFNMLRSVFIMPGHMPQDSLFYGIFGLEW